MALQPNDEPLAFEPAQVVGGLPAGVGAPSRAVTARTRAGLSNVICHGDGTTGLPPASRLRIPDRQIVGDDGSKVAGLRGTGSPAQILVQMWTKGRASGGKILCRNGDGKRRYLVSSRDQRAQPSAD
jgi:hypothetical protein